MVFGEQARDGLFFSECSGNNIRVRRGSRHTMPDESTPLAGSATAEDDNAQSFCGSMSKVRRECAARHEFGRVHLIRARARALSRVASRRSMCTTTRLGSCTTWRAPAK